jgi:hypothetical protein
VPPTQYGEVKLLQMHAASLLHTAAVQPLPQHTAGKHTCETTTVRVHNHTEITPDTHQHTPHTQLHSSAHTHQQHNTQNNHPAD